MNLLFLCTGNACRSQMAEGWARELAGDWLRVQSAGIEAHGRNQRAIAVMMEAGVDISGQASTRVTDEMLAVGVVNRSRGWYERQPGVVAYRECCPPGVHLHAE